MNENEQTGGETIAAATPMVTFDMLVKKPKRSTKVEITLPDGDGGQVKAAMRFEALSSAEYDELLAAHPPKPADRERGAIWNSKTFPAALVAKCMVEPKLSYEQVLELSVSPQWSSGEFSEFFIAANRLCMEGLNVPFSERG